MQRVNQLTLILLTFYLFSFHSHAQYCKLIKEVKLNDKRSYFWNMYFSNSKKYLIVNQGIVGAFLLDNNLNVIEDVRNHCPVVGSDIAFLTSDEKYFVGTTKYCDWKNDDIERVYDTLSIKNLNTQEIQYLLINEQNNKIPFQKSNKFLISYFGKLEIYDIEKNRITPVSLKLGKQEHIKGLILNNDKDILMATEKYGFGIYDMESWKLKKEFEKLYKEYDGRQYPVQMSNMQVHQSQKYYYYSIDNMVYVREMKSHKLYKKYELKFRPANITFSSDFSFCLIKVHYVEAIFYYDLNTMEYTKLLESEDFLPFSDIELTPDENHFITGVNGNRLLQYKIHKEGVAPENIQKVKIFEYTEEDAKKIDSEIIKIELALKKLGYDIVLDNMVSGPERLTHKKFCKDYNIEYFWSEETKKILGIE